ncbi:MAG: ABC transporter permease, partial [Pigmentiphaga sp.]
MLTFLLRRTLATVPVLVIVALIVFLMTRLAPGDPAAIMVGDSASLAQIEQVRAQLGLDQPLPLQFVQWSGQVLQGELGKSLFLNQSVASLIGQRIEPTLSLAALTIVLTVLLAVPLGVLAAWRHGGWLDRALMSFS